MPWLMKAEPDSRVVKGKNVKFSVDDFEEIGTSPWDGVRSHEAKAIMKSKMKLGDKVLFYHSNCKVPGVFALAEVAKEGYPDYTAWDESHPYYDPKSDKDNPTWYMVSVKFLQRLPHPPTLALIKHLAELKSLPDEIAYIGADGLQAIKSMPLINRGRLSVQPVDEAAYDAVVLLGTKGGWDDLLPQKGKSAKRTKDDAEEEDAKSAPDSTPKPTPKSKANEEKKAKPAKATAPKASAPKAEVNDRATRASKRLKR